MHLDPKKKPLQPKVDALSVMAPEKTGQFKLPPQFSLDATSQLKEAPRSTAPGQDPKPMKDHKKDVEYGPARSGPIAEQGYGDANKFAANDVNQGMLGDCYMLASLMALAMQSPDVLEKAISGPKGDGTYDVTLYRRKGRGKRKTFTPETINVSSSFIVDKASQREYYAHGGDTDSAGNEELWVKLIEKAYAKMHGSFDKVDGGWEEDALEILTGQEHTQHDFNGGFFGRGKMTDADLKQNILDALAAGKAVTCSTYSQSKLNRVDKKESGFAAQNEVVGYHAYAVVKADDTSITVRNPWGDGAATPEPVLTWAQFRQYFSEYTTRN